MCNSNVKLLSEMFCCRVTSEVEKTRFLAKYEMIHLHDSLLVPEEQKLTVNLHAHINYSSKYCILNVLKLSDF